MRLYTVHIRPDSAAPDRDARLVREGFAVGAFLFTALWALWHRMWWAALALFGVTLLLGAAVGIAGFEPLAQAAIGVGWQLVVGFLANDLRRWDLARRGYEEVAVVAGDDLTGAERRFFDHFPPPTAAVP